MFFIWQINIIVYRIQSGYVNTILYLHLSKIEYNQYKRDIVNVIKRLCKHKVVEIIEGYIMPAYIHLLLSMPPEYSVSSIIGYLKGKRLLMIFDMHSNLKYKYGNRKFWAEGYYVSTVGLNESTIKNT